MTFPLAFRSELDVLTARRIGKIVREHEIDILHAHTAHGHMMACLGRKFAGRGKVVVSRRVDFVPKQTFTNRIKYGMPDRYVAISRKIGDVLREFGIGDDKISVVYSAIDPGRMDVEAVPRGELPCESSGPLIGNVAALVDHKDQGTLIRAMQVVLKEIPDASLVIAGEGTLRGELERLVGELELGERVHFLGYRDDVPCLMGALDVFVMSSKEEGLCTSILDAMAAGVPVAATAGGGIPEIVRHEETGLLAEIGDVEALGGHIVRLLRDSELCANLKGNARAMIEKTHTVERMVEGNLAVYEELMR
jgi:glycosyltransferase involved in cell wall biosynthesis